MSYISIFNSLSTARQNLGERYRMKKYCFYVVHNIDFRELLDSLDTGSVDLIVTDPPYARGYESCYGEMAKRAKRVLRRGGSLITLCGHHQLARILPTMGEHLKYRWIIKHDQPGASRRLAMGIRTTWKPMLWYVNEVLSPNVCVADTVNATKVKTSGHPWEQSEMYAAWAIGHLTKEGETIVDPFAGSGTTLVVAQKLKRKWVGSETDEIWCERANQRVYGQLGIPDLGEMPQTELDDERSRELEI